MIESAAAAIAEHIKKNVPDHPASIARMKYSLEIVLNTALIIFFTSLIAAFLGKLSTVLVLMASFAILRQLTGGKHLPTGEWCVVVSTSLFIALSFISLQSPWITIATVCSIFLILIFAPAGIERQTRIPKKYYPALKIAGIVLVSTNLFIQSPAIAIAVLTQSLTLIHGRG